jgi:hypothetical protein
MEHMFTGKILPHAIALMRAAALMRAIVLVAPSC